MENCTQPQPIVNRTEKKNERKRERYTQMNNDSKNELLAKRRATYHQKRTLAGKCFVIDDHSISTCTLAYKHFIIHVNRAH
jgi:hypothetical protein